MVAEFAVDGDSVKLASELAANGEVGAAPCQPSLHVREPNQVRHLHLKADFVEVGSKDLACVAHGHTHAACEFAAQCFKATKGISVAQFQCGLKAINARSVGAFGLPKHSDSRRLLQH